MRIITISLLVICITTLFNSDCLGMRKKYTPQSNTLNNYFPITTLPSNDYQKSPRKRKKTVPQSRTLDNYFGVSQSSTLDSYNFDASQSSTIDFSQPVNIPQQIPVNTSSFSQPLSSFSFPATPFQKEYMEANLDWFFKLRRRPIHEREKALTDANKKFGEFVKLYGEGQYADFRKNFYRELFGTTGKNQASMDEDELLMVCLTLTEIIRNTEELDEKDRESNFLFIIQSVCSKARENFFQNS